MLQYFIPDQVKSLANIEAAVPVQQGSESSQMGKTRHIPLREGPNILQYLPVLGHLGAPLLGEYPPVFNQVYLVNSTNIQILLVEELIR